MLEPTDIEIRREIARARRAVLCASAQPGGGRPAPIRSLGTLLVSVGLRLAPPETHAHPAGLVPSGRREAPGRPGASLARCN